MKKTAAVLLCLLMPFVILFCGCKSYDYTPYYHMVSKGGGGPNIYAWQVDDGSWRCAAFHDLNRGISEEELAYFQNELPCPLKEMRKILNTYSDVARENTIIFVVRYIKETSDSNKFFSELTSDKAIPETYRFLYRELGLQIPDYL
ncbi:MAG: hypothetical protein K2N23_05920 [Clostridia bacterium]|nr:hypothetical protein [Clostridia bacterium]